MMQSGLSASDVAMISRNNGSNDSFGGNGSWIWIILILAIFFGWGGNGFGYGARGGYGGGGGQVGDNYVLASDMSQLSKLITDTYTMTDRKLDGITNGLSNGFYTEAQLINGVQMSMANNTAALQQGLVTQGFETRNAITQDTIANMQGFNGVTAAIKDCSCNTQSGMKDINYNLATQANGITNAVNQGFCQTNFNNQTNTRDILESQNANTKAILDAIQSNKIEALKDRIAEQNQQINALNLAASQQAQNAYLINQLKPLPIPAYAVPNPYCCNNTGCGCAN